MTTKTKRISPYTRLLNEIISFIDNLKYRHKKLMWRYPKKTMETGSWNLNDLHERTAAAQQLGYEVKLVACDQGLEVYYIKEIPNIPGIWGGNK